MKESFEEKGLVPIDRLARVTADVERINQMETVIDLYSQKIKTVKADETLDEDEREAKIDYWQRLRDRDISRLEE